MIQNDSIVAIKDTFVSVERLDVGQMIQSLNGLTLLIRIEENNSSGFWLETQSFEIIVSPEQKFLTARDIYTKAKDLTVGQLVLTSDGFQAVRSIKETEGNFEMADLVTSTGNYKANGFILVSDYGKNKL